MVIVDSRQEEIRHQLGEEASRFAWYETAEELLDQEQLDGVIIGRIVCRAAWGCGSFFRTAHLSLESPAILLSFV